MQKGAVRNTFKDFIESEKTGGLLLILCTIVSLLIANSSIGVSYVAIWETSLGIHTLTEWINDGLMVIFFFLIGLELVENVKDGDLSDIRSAMLPVSAALGGMLVPAAIFLYLNWGLPTERGAGIPMATDIAFALGVLSLLGSRVPMSLKVFLTALAVIDDLGAIIVIAVFYSTDLSALYLFGSLGVFALLMVMNKVLKIHNIIPYLIGGVLMWYLMLNSGVHATIAGVLLAITIPYKKGVSGKDNPNRVLQYRLHYPVAFVILPIFALANTAIHLEGNWDSALGEPFALGIIFGLLVGKPLGIGLFSFLSVKLKLCKLPSDINWTKLFSVGILGGIGFTMSIFISLLAFDDHFIINESKLMIMLSSLAAGIFGFTILSLVLKKEKADYLKSKAKK